MIWKNVSNAIEFNYLADAKDTDSEKSKSENLKFKKSSEQTDCVETNLLGKYFTFNRRSQNYIFDFVIPDSFFQKCVEYPPDVLV